MTGERRPDGTQPGDDHLMMTSPEYWPNWPILPLKRKRLDWGLPDTGILYDRTADDDWEEGDDPSLRFRFLDDCLMALVTMGQLMAAPVADINKLLAEGWVVD